MSSLSGTLSSLDSFYSSSDARPSEAPNASGSVLLVLSYFFSNELILLYLIIMIMRIYCYMIRRMGISISLCYQSIHFSLSIIHWISTFIYHWLQVSVVVECLPTNVLICFFFFIQQALESRQLLVHVVIDLEVSTHDLLHLIHIVINVLVFRVLTLDVRNQLTLLSYEHCNFLKVLKMVSA